MEWKRLVRFQPRGTTFNGDLIMPKSKVLIVVYGGVVSAVYVSDQNTEVDIVDYDNEKADGRSDDAISDQVDKEVEANKMIQIC